MKRVRKMASVTQRVLVHFQSEHGQTTEAQFTQSILKTLGLTKGNDMKLYAELNRNTMLLGSKPWHKQLRPVKMRRPSFCPILNLTPELTKEIAPEILSRGIDVGCATILESGDGKVLLTRRAKHLRTFPNVWVPPGGHVEVEETLHQAALRELEEETGLKIKAEQCMEEKIPILALWESVYPAKLAAGLPKRHHCVVYVYAKLKPEYTSDRLQTELRPDPGEVGACAWIPKSTIEVVLKASDEEKADGGATELLKNLPKTFRSTIVNPDGTTCPEDLDTSILYQRAPESGDDVQRVSTGTKFALEEWMNLTEESKA